MTTTTTTSTSVVLVSSDESIPLRQALFQCSKDNPLFKNIEAQVSDCLFDEGFVDNNNEDLIRSVVLLRPQDGEAGLYAFFVSDDNTSSNSSREKGYQDESHNVRATRLSMACGLFNLRFRGPVLLLRSTRGGRIQALDLSDVEAACCWSPDLRWNILEILKQENMKLNSIPDWMANAAQQNYHDQAALDHLAKAMSVEAESEIEQAQEVMGPLGSNVQEPNDEIQEHSKEAINSTSNTNSTFVAKSPLCLHCRRPCHALCPNCQGAYFCEAPSSCSVQGWSHECLCATWKVYVDRRTELSTLDGLGDWHKELTSRAFQVSDGPYQELLGRWGISKAQPSWWRTETDGWMGGTSSGAQAVNVYNRLTYLEGFSPIQDIPPEQPVTEVDLERIGPVEKNSVGMLVLSSWEQYYRLRGIPTSSPVALLLSFPLTLYHAIVVFGQVPATVATMLHRPIRIHLVGIEKELNFLDLFKEVSFLLPQDVKLELVFIVREDMIPKKTGDCHAENPSGLRLQLTTNLTLILVSGTYGESLDPNFDCGSGPPDMVVGMNAGLFAYASWRSVVTYLYHSPNVVGVFTDYNEHSGVNCASLGGRTCRQSLQVNPFRQPRAMPVYSMNLPQFSNGFFYVFNEQIME